MTLQTSPTPTTRVTALYTERSRIERATTCLQARGISHRDISELSSALKLEVAHLEGINLVGEMAPAAIAAIEALRHVYPVVTWQAVLRYVGFPARAAALYCDRLRQGDWMVVRVAPEQAAVNHLLLELLGGRHALTVAPALRVLAPVAG